MTDETLQKARELYESGLSLEKTAKALGIGKTTVLFAFRRNGIGTRQPYLNEDPVDHNFFEVLDSDAKAYFAGFLLADGYIRDQSANPSIHLVLQAQDHHILESLREVVGTRNPVHVTPRICSIVWTSAKMAQDLLRYSIFPRKTKRKKFLIQNVPEEFHGSFIRGFFDGNGWISHSTRINWLIGFGDGEEFLEQLRDYLCDRFGLYRIKVTTHGGSNLMSWSAKKDVRTLLHFMYKDATYYLFRKHKKAMKCIREYEGEDATL